MGAAVVAAAVVFADVTAAVVVAAETAVVSSSFASYIAAGVGPCAAVVVDLAFVFEVAAVAADLAEWALVGQGLPCQARSFAHHVERSPFPQVFAPGLVPTHEG